MYLIKQRTTPAFDESRYKWLTDSFPPAEIARRTALARSVHERWMKGSPLEEVIKQSSHRPRSVNTRPRA